MKRCLSPHGAIGRRRGHTGRVIESVPCMLMRGGTSKGAYFRSRDRPADPAQRDDLILRIVGSPDPRQIDGIGGAHVLTTKVAVVGPAAGPGAAVDYLFLQPSVDEPLVSDAQNCGNMLAGVGPFAVERSMIAPGGAEARVRIHMVNTGSVATATFPLRDGMPDYAGRAARFNFVRHLGGGDLGAFERTARRVAPRGWHMVVHLDAADLGDFAGVLLSLPCPFIIDHMARVPAAGGLSQPAFAALLDLMEDDRAWVKISGAERLTAGARPP